MATTVVQPPPGQPMFVPPGTAPVAPPGMVAPPGTVMYYPQAAGGAVIMSAVVAQPAKYEYRPNDFMVLSLITLILCGIFSPLSMALSIPALLLSLQSKKNAEAGAIKVARKQGMVAAYLSVAAIVAALVVACLVMGFVLGLYGPIYKCSFSYSYSYYC